MLAEVLLVLSGHPSSFFVPHPAAPHRPTTLRVSPDLATYLHPGEMASLNSLADIAFVYTSLREWARAVIERTRESILVQTRKGKEKERDRDRDREGGHGAGDVYLSTLASGILDVLKSYESLAVDIEAKILHLDKGLVQDGRGHVPLSALVAALSTWSAPLHSLQHLVASFRGRAPTPGQLIQLTHDRGQCGNPDLQKIYAELLAPLTRLFLTHLQTFLLFGLAPSASTPTNPAIAIDSGPDPMLPRHRVYVLNDDLIPKSVGPHTRESLLYVGRVAATLRREGKELPKAVVDDLRVQVSNVKLDQGGSLDRAMGAARKEVGEWLWKNILTGQQIIDALETFGNYSLTRNGDYASALIRELDKVRLDRLVLSEPTSSSSVIRDADLNLALLRASVGTLAEHDRSLEGIKLRLDNGPLRTIPVDPPRQKPGTKEGSIGSLFSSILLGAPVTLHHAVGWPLDLFMTPPARASYTDIHAYLFALRSTHGRVLDTWTSLSSAQRRRRKWTGASEGGTKVQAAKRIELARTAWGTVRLMLFFLDELLNHFMTDIIDVQHRNLLSLLDPVTGAGSGTVDGLHRSASQSASLRSSVRLPQTSSVRTMAGAGRQSTRTSSPGSTADLDSVRFKMPPTPNKDANYLDFLTLRQLHARHLAFLREGLLIADRSLAVVIRNMLDVCNRFAGLVERWGGDVLPELAQNEHELENTVQERSKAVLEVKDEMHELLSDFFRALVESLNPVSTENNTVADADMNAGTSFSRTARATAMIQSSRLVSARQASFASKSGVGAGGMSAKTVAKAGAAGGGGGSKAQVEQSQRSQEAEALMLRHVEQLILRLDFNGVLTLWLAQEEEGQVAKNGVLAEGGL